jgi:hypothetical protein
MKWLNVFRIPKTMQDDVEAEALVSAIQRSPSLQVLPMLAVALDTLAVALLLLGHPETAIAMAIAGSLNLILAGLLWNVGAKRWAAKDFLIGIVGVSFAVVLKLIS